MELMNLFDSALPGSRDEGTIASLAARLGTMVQMHVYPRSISAAADKLYFLAREDGLKRLGVLSRVGPGIIHTHASMRELQEGSRSMYLTLCPTDAESATILRNSLEWLQPRTLGLQKSAGCGDRLGLATPGHVRAVRACKRSMAPIFAQQSIREMARTQRMPQQVIDEAMWGVFQEGWRDGYGADADHLKTTEDIDRCVAAGFTFFTFDPGAHVGLTDGLTYASLPWQALETAPGDLLRRYAGKFDGVTLEQAMLKYGRSIAHVTHLYRHLKVVMAGRAFEVEVSVDETEQPTTYAEHFVIAGELRRLGVEWVSLAPRFTGRFEKGVDYIGDVTAFERDFADHVKVARHWGPYKLSIHSGSDKFSIYPIVARLAGDLVHLKTAGTSYLEALRTITRCDPWLFQQVYALAYERYLEDRASYHVSAELARAPSPTDIPSMPDITQLLDQFDARQMLHVCFGSILAKYGDEIKTVLHENEESHYANLQRHFEHHLESFC